MITRGTDSQNLLGFQNQNQAMLLLQSLQGFSGSSSVEGLKAPRFEQWIRSFESILEIASWDEERKVKLLSSKLTGIAAEALDDYVRSGKTTYSTIKLRLMERFHGHETRLMYSQEYKNCRMQPSELAIEYACRLKKLFYLTFPLTDADKANTDTLNKLEEVLKDKFVDGLSFEIRHRVRDKSFKTFDELVKYTSNKSSYYEDEKKDKEERKRIANIYDNESGRDRQQVALVEEIRAIRSEIQAIQMGNNGYPSQRHQIGQAAHLKSLDTKGNNQTNMQQQRGIQGTSGYNQGFNGNGSQLEQQGKCEFCGIWNHGKEACRKYAKTFVTCFTCNGKGHYSWECQLKDGQGNGQGGRAQGDSQQLRRQGEN